MNEFDEEKQKTEEQNSSTSGTYYTPPENEPENGTTYHYAYKKPEESEKKTTVNGKPPKEEKVPKPKKEKPVYYDANGNPIKKASNKTIITIFAIVLVCIIVAIVGIVFAYSNAGSSTNNKTETTTSATDSSGVTTEEQGSVATSDADGNYTVAGVAKKCTDSCVGITVYTNSSSYGDIYSYGSNGSSSSSDGSSQKSGEGSGIIMSESSGKTYIMTCAHVISDASSFKVTLNDGTKYDATMVGYDSQTDIGVLSIDATGLSVATFANSDSTVVGEQVVAIGCPGGLTFMNSLTAGYVSAVDRPVSSSIGYNNECIQTDAAINPGNSGGALFNMQGQVIGVNSSKIASTEYEGMGFAVPSNTAVSTANSIIKNGYVSGRAKLGVTYTPITKFSNASSILSALEEKGFEDANGTMVISQVSSESDLASKDIQQYDMVVAINGKTLTSTDVMTSLLSDSKPGDSVTLTIARISGNEIKTFEVKCTLIEDKGND